MKVPHQLQKEEYRFCLIKAKSKVPRGKEWQKKGYKFDDKNLLGHIKKGGNYGCIGGYGNLVIIDIDDPKLAEELFKKLNTFCVKTPGGTYHFYFEVKDEK